MFYELEQFNVPKVTVYTKIMIQIYFQMIFNVEQENMKKLQDECKRATVLTTDILR